jgi:hypothetical protein
MQNRVNTAGVAALNPKAKTAAPTKPKKMPTHQRLALAVGGVGCFLLALSVVDCTVAYTRVTGMSYLLAAMMAVGIDVQMVLSELASVHSPKGSEAKRWAEAYVHIAVGMSVCLNAGAAAAQADGWLIYAAIPAGGIIPVFVYIAGRTAGALWTRK